MSEAEHPNTSNITYVRWRAGQPRRCRIFPPLPRDHPAYHAPCAVCGRQLGDGAGVQLIAVGPDDAEARDRHATGRWYAALAVLAHVGCVSLFDDTELDRVAAELAADAP